MKTSSSRGYYADFAALRTQVTNLEDDYKDLKIVVVSLDKKIDSSTASLISKMDEKSVTPWATIWGGLTVTMTLTMLLGWLALQPIQTTEMSLRSDLSAETAKRERADALTGQKLDEASEKINQLIGMLKAFKVGQ